MLLELDANVIDGDVRYAVDVGATERRRRKVGELRASLPRVPEGDIELRRAPFLPCSPPSRSRPVLVSSTGKA